MLNDFAAIGKLFNARKSFVRVPNLDPKYKIAILASKQVYANCLQDHCLVDMLHDFQDVFSSNHDRAPNNQVIFLLRRHGIHYFYLPTNVGNNREEEILDLVKGTDFLVLARYMQAYNSGIKLIGATTDFVNPELDAGPIIEQMVERVSHKDTLQTLVQKSENLEKQCLRKAIQSYCELRVLPYEGKKTVLF